MCTHTFSCPISLPAFFLPAHLHNLCPRNATLLAFIFPHTHPLAPSRSRPLPALLLANASPPPPLRAHTQPALVAFYLFTLGVTSSAGLSGLSTVRVYPVAGQALQVAIVSTQTVYIRCVRARACLNMCARACIGECVCVSACVCLCVCVCERERERYSVRKCVCVGRTDHLCACVRLSVLSNSLSLSLSLSLCIYIFFFTRSHTNTQQRTHRLLRYRSGPGRRRRRRRSSGTVVFLEYGAGRRQYQ
jgi:hypothetical protein